MSFWDDIKKFAQPYAADEDYDDYDDEMEDDYAEEHAAPRFTREAPSSSAADADSGFTSAPAASTSFTPSSGTGFSGTVINTTSGAKQQVILTRPVELHYRRGIATNLRNKKAGGAESGECRQGSGPPCGGLPVRDYLCAGRLREEGLSGHLPVLPPQHGGFG